MQLVARISPMFLTPLWPLGAHPCFLLLPISLFLHALLFSPHVSCSTLGYHHLIIIVI